MQEPPAPKAPADGAANDSSDEDHDPTADSAGVYYTTLPKGHHFGPTQRQACLPLLPGETVMHVAWQRLQLLPPPAAAAPRAPPASGRPAAGPGVSAAGGPHDAIAAVLTNQRLLLLTSSLRVVCAVGLASYGCTALPSEPCGVTSLVWAGPMLLLSTAAGQVLQLTWTGRLLPVATLSPTGHMSLLGVTADALVLLRTPLAPALPTAAGTVASASPAATAALAEAILRPASLLQPLLIGWSSLAATGLLPYGSYGTGIVRPALRYAMESYDAAAGVTPQGVWSLIAAGAWDVAAVVAETLPPLDGGVKLAAAAAAGRWQAVAAALAAEASRALHAPAAPPRGSALHAKLVAAAAGALGHGQLAVAQELLLAAGGWRSVACA